MARWWRSARIRPPDHGTIVQSGPRSATGRSAPVRVLRCQARHQRVTESVRCELLPTDRVRITSRRRCRRQHAQFSWVLSRLPRHPHRSADLPAGGRRQGVVFAADHPERKEHWSARHRGDDHGAEFAAPVLDRYLAAPATTRSRRSSGPTRASRANLWQPVDQQPGSDEGAHGAFDDRSHARARSLSLTERVEQAGTVAVRALDILRNAARSRRLSPGATPRGTRRAVRPGSGDTVQGRNSGRIQRPTPKARQPTTRAHTVTVQAAPRDQPGPPGRDGVTAAVRGPRPISLRRTAPLPGRRPPWSSRTSAAAGDRARVHLRGEAPCKP